MSATCWLRTEMALAVAAARVVNGWWMVVGRLWVLCIGYWMAMVVMVVLLVVLLVVGVGVGRA